MARRWSVSDAYVALQSGNKTDRAEIAKRFPLFATASADEILRNLPHFVSARQVEVVLRGDGSDQVFDESEDQAAETLEEEPAPVKKTRKTREAVEEAPAPVETKRSKKAAQVAVADPDEEDDDDNLDDELESLFDDDEE